MINILSCISDYNSVRSVWTLASNVFMLAKNGADNLPAVLKPILKFLYPNRKHRYILFIVHKTVFSQHNYSISTFIYSQSMNFEISIFILQISFDRFSIYSICLLCYSLPRQTDFRIFFSMRTNFICQTFHTLLNKLSVSKWFWLFVFAVRFVHNYLSWYSLFEL